MGVCRRPQLLCRVAWAARHGLLSCLWRTRPRPALSDLNTTTVQDGQGCCIARNALWGESSLPKKEESTPSSSVSSCPTSKRGERPCAKEKKARSDPVAALSSTGGARQRPGSSADRCRACLRGGGKPAVISHQPSAISHWPQATSQQLTE